MHRFSLIFSVLMVTTVSLSSVAAHEVKATTADAKTMTDAQRIEHAMKSLFDKPDAPLKVVPVTIDGNYAVAGWVQSGRGGRALLKKEKNAWIIQVCGGDGLTQAAQLAMTGMTADVAQRLAVKVAAEEKKLPVDVLKKLAMFEGVVKVDHAQHGAHASQHPPHHGHAK